MKISVLTACLNAEKYIDRAIQSVLMQDYPNFEHIIIDGLSSDSTISIIEKYDHINWISEKDSGQSDAMNKAFELSTGDVIIYLNADDYLESNVFKSIIDTFAQCNSDIVVGDLLIKSEENEDFRIITPKYSFNEIIYPQVFKFPYNPVSYYYKRQVQETIGLFPKNEHYAMDYWFLIRAFDKFNVSKINKVLGTFYLSRFNKTTVNKKTNLYLIAYEYIRTKSKWSIVKFYILNLYYNIYLSMIYLKWIKIPIKYLIYLIRYRDKYSTFQEFNSIGFKKSIN